jgi:hypothetical protein
MSIIEVTTQMLDPLKLTLQNNTTDDVIGSVEIAWMSFQKCGLLKL